MKESAGEGGGRKESGTVECQSTSARSMDLPFTTRLNGEQVCDSGGTWGCMWILLLGDVL
jgi:hypothetical protein